MGLLLTSNVVIPCFIISTVYYFMCKLLSLLYEREKCQKVIVSGGNCQGDKDVNVGIQADYHSSITFIHAIKKA